VKGASFGADYIANKKEEARKFLTVINKEMDENGPWMWGKEGPNILDAHLVTFLARMQDAGNENFLTGKLIRYLEKAKKTPRWQGVMEGRNTLPASLIPSSSQPSYA
jgi:hypothetical protein